ncbi:MAG: DUF1669 domain-containing protein [Anaerolineales bacterium]|nr:DUF1669 domain-containing protein [Anaerolineales bacterium]
MQRLTALVLLATLTGACLPTDGPAALPTVDAPLVATPSNGWYDVYFTTPELTAQQDPPVVSGPTLALIEGLGRAQHTLDVAVYELDNDAIADALIAAHARGVQVRVVTDTDYLSEAAMLRVMAAGIPVIGDAREPFMHHKFTVVDGSEVWTGSMNYTYNDAYRNNNVLIHIRSVRLAENYSAEFEQLFTRQAFEQAGKPPNPTLTLSGTLVENAFSPKGDVADRILDVLRTAHSSVHVMAFAFTRTDFGDALLERAQGGVTVQAVFERRQVAAGSDAVFDLFSAAGVPARLDGNQYNLHTKAIIVDSAIVVFGSYNFSRNAEEQNNENALIVHSPELAATFEAEFQKVWAQAEP